MPSNQEHAVSEIEQQIVEELKRRFPPPWFKNWRVRENWGGSQMAEMFVAGMVSPGDGRVVVAIASDFNLLLGYIRSLPAPPPEPAPPVEVTPGEDAEWKWVARHRKIIIGSIFETLYGWYRRYTFTGVGRRPRTWIVTIDDLRHLEKWVANLEELTCKGPLNAEHKFTLGDQYSASVGEEFLTQEAELAALRERLRVAKSKPCPVCEQRAQFAKSITSGEYREQHKGDG